MDRPDETSFSRKMALHALIGAGAGAVAVPVMKPFYHAKLMGQLGQPVGANPLVWYKGSSAFGLSFVFPTVIQVTVNELARDYLERHHGRAPNLPERMGLAATAGCLSAFPMAFLEAMILQRKEGKSYGQSLKCIALRREGIQPSAVALTACREAPFAVTYLVGVPVVREYLEGRGVNPAASALLAGVGVGTVCAVVTQPVDTAKSRIQKGMFLPPNWKGYFGGLKGRLGVVTAAVTVLPPAKKAFDAYLRPRILPKKAKSE